MADYTKRPSPEDARAQARARIRQSAELRTSTNTQFGQIVSSQGRSEIGIDTVHLTLSTSFAEVAPHFRARVSVSASTDDGALERGCILYTDTAGRPVVGDKAALNTPDWQLTILPLGDDGNVLLQTSAKAYAENNTELMSRVTLDAILRRIEADLAERGLRCDLLGDSRINRLDIARNVPLSHAVPSYVGLFREMPTTGRVRPHADGDDYFRLGTSGWQVALYDKGQEQAAKLAKLAKSRATPPPSRILRGELRFLKSREVDSRFESRRLTPKQLLRPERFEALPGMFREALASSLLATERPPSNHMSMSDDTVKLWAEVQTRVAQLAKPGSAKYYRLVHHAMLAGAAGPDGARQWFRENFGDDGTDAAKRRQQRFNQELKKAGAVFGAVQDEPSKMTRDELYNELKDGLLRE